MVTEVGERNDNIIRDVSVNGLCVCEERRGA